MGENPVGKVAFLRGNSEDAGCWGTQSEPGSCAQLESLAGSSAGKPPQAPAASLGRGFDPGLLVPWDSGKAVGASLGLRSWDRGGGG